MNPFDLPSLRGLRPRKFGLVSWSSHVPFAFDLVAELRPKLLVELGTHSGESYFAFCQAVQENNVGASCYAVDTWKGDEQAGFYGEEIYREVARHNQEFYGSFSYLVRATFDDAVAQFADDSIDLLHIDGLHTYEAVKHDFETWLPKVSPAGVVLFHDIAARHGDFGAWKLWDELKSAHGSFTFHHGWGLGIWRRDAGTPLASPFLQALFSGDAAEAENIRRYYGLAAENLRLRSDNERLRALVPPDLHAGPLPPPAPAGEGDLHLQVYFPRDGNYREDASSQFALKTGQWMKLEIALPTDWTGAPLRIDPISACGLIEIASLRVASRLFDHTVWACLGRDALLPLPIHGTARLLSDERFLRLLSYGGDPQIFTPEIDLVSFDEPLKLEISLRARTDWPAIAKVLKGWADQLEQLPVLTSRAESLEVARHQAAEAAGRATEELAAVRAEAAAELAALREASAQAATVAAAELAASREAGAQAATLAAAELAVSREAAAQASAALTAELATVRENAAQAAAGALADLAVAQEDLDQARQRSAQLSGALLAAWQFLLGVNDEVGRREAEARILDAQLHDVRDSLAASHDQLLETNARLREEREARQEADQEIEALTAEAAGLHGELSAAASQVAAENARLRETLLALRNTEEALDSVRQEWDVDHGRVASMRQSGSWKLTLPLRALHRTLTGRQPTGAGANGSNGSNGSHGSRAAAGADETENPPRELPAFTVHFDEPADWNLPTRQVHVRGWYLPREEKARPAAITARWGDQEVAGRLGLARPDVVAHLKCDRGDMPCGFDFNLQLPAGPSRVIIAVTNDLGQTWPVGEFAARTPYGARPRRSAAMDPATDYGRWAALHDTFGAEALRQLRVQARSLPFQPLISILMPAYNTPEKWLTKAIDSVRRQVYAHWELCIADDASTQPQVRATLNRYAAADARIKVVYRPTNGHISGASNSALALATGEFTALLDHDDELAAHALYAVALELNAHPSADLIYSDEDKVDEEGRRFSPYFKPDWNPDLFNGQNYISHLGVYRTELIRRVGGFRAGFEGCQDWDLALRVTEQIPAKRIRHIPRVLYHWRAIAGSTALALSEKDYGVNNSQRLLEEHCRRTGTKATVEPVAGGHFRLRRALPEPKPFVSIIIPTRNRVEILRPCLESILERSTYAHYEVILVDNQSDDPETVAYLAALRGEDVRVLRYDHPFNFSAMNNFAVAQARGQLVCLLNNDIEVITPDWLEEMASQACRPEIGAVGAMLYYPDDTIQHAGAVLGIGAAPGAGGVAGHAFKTFPRGTDGQCNRARLVQNYTAVTAACLLIRKTVYQEVGGFEEKRLRIGFNDIDFCLRVYKAGYRNLWTPFAEFYHHESVSRGLEDTPEKHERFQAEVAYMRQRWGALLDADPAYNPNLTHQREDFTFAVPPRVPSLVRPGASAALSTASRATLASAVS